MKEETFQQNKMTNLEPLSLRSSNVDWQLMNGHMMLWVVHQFV